MRCVSILVALAALVVPAHATDPVGMTCAGVSVWDNFLVQDIPRYTASTTGGPLVVPGATRVTVTCTWYGVGPSWTHLNATVTNTTTGQVGYVVAPVHRYRGGAPEEQVLCTYISWDTPSGSGAAPGAYDDERCPPALS